MHEIMEKFTARKLYIITTLDNWPVKIGVSADPDKRLVALQRSNWKQLVLYAVFDCKGATNAAYQLEAKIHKALAHKHLVSEWFDITAEQAKGEIEIETLFSFD